jgi:hypothetical protein
LERYDWKFIAAILAVVVAVALVALRVHVA